MAPSGLSASKMSSCRAVSSPEASSGAAAGDEKPSTCGAHAKAERNVSKVRARGGAAGQRTYPKDTGESAVSATAMYTPSAEPPAPAAGGGSSGVTALSVAMRAARRRARGAAPYASPAERSAEGVAAS